MSLIINIRLFNLLNCCTFSLAFFPIYQESLTRMESETVQSGSSFFFSQGALSDFDDLVFACGSGGTAAGLSIANYLTGSKLRYGLC